MTIRKAPRSENISGVPYTPRTLFRALAREGGEEPLIAHLSRPLTGGKTPDASKIMDALKTITISGGVRSSVSDALKNQEEFTSVIEPLAEKLGMKPTKLRRLLTPKIAMLFQAQPKAEGSAEFFKRITNDGLNEEDINKLMTYVLNDDARHLSRELGKAKIDKYALFDSVEDYYGSPSRHKPESNEEFESSAQVSWGRYTASYGTGQETPEGRPTGSGKKTGFILLEEIDDDDSVKEREAQIREAIEEEVELTLFDRLVYVFEYPPFYEKLFGKSDLKIVIEGSDLQPKDTLEANDVATYLNAIGRMKKKSLLLPKLGPHNVASSFFSKATVNPVLLKLLMTGGDEVLESTLASIRDESYISNEDIEEAFGEDRGDFLYLRRDMWEVIEPMLEGESPDWKEKIEEVDREELEDEIEELPSDYANEITTESGITKMPKNEFTDKIEELMSTIESLTGIPSSIPIKNPEVSFALDDPTDRQIFSLFADKIDRAKEGETRGVFEFDEYAMDMAYKARLQPIEGLSVLTNFSYLLDDTMESITIDLDKTIDEYLTNADKQLLTKIESDIGKFKNSLSSSLDGVLSVMIEGVRDKLQDIATRRRFYVNEVGEELYEALQNNDLLEEVE